MPANREIECKIPLTAREPLVEKLLALGADDHGDALEQNRVYDRDGELREGHRLLRVRSCGGTVTVTYKGAPEPGRFKQRTEIEIRADSFDQTCLLFESLGYRTAWYYEKRRHALRYQGCEIALDLLPELGAFLEIEGPNEEAVEGVLRALDHTPEEHVAASYLGLHAARCRESGRPAGDLRFNQATC